MEKISPKDWSRFLATRAAVILAAAQILNLAGYLGKLHRFLDLTSHFKVQYLCVSLACLVVILAAKRWRWAAIAALPVAINGWVVLSWYIPPAELSGGAPLKLLVCNVYTANERHDLLLELVRRERPELIVLAEVNDAWMESLRQLETEYPFAKSFASDDNFGIAVFSRVPVEKFRILFCGGANVPSISARLSVGGRSVALIATHPLPPLGGEYFRLRNRQLEEIGAMVRDTLGPVILAGDLNTTMWSPHYQDFERISGLRNARKGFGILPTWPTDMLSWILRVPIDHCLVRGDIHVSDLRTGSSIGSDHFPLIAELRLFGCGRKTP